MIVAKPGQRRFAVSQPETMMMDRRRLRRKRVGDH
jgi:hypothetical protein